MGKPLYDRRTAAEWMSASQVIEINEELASFAGLAQVVADDLAALEPADRPRNWQSAPVTGSIAFGRIEAGRPLATVSGCIRSTVDAVCQRCLEAFRLSLAAEPRLLLLKTDEEVLGFDDYEVWELEDARLRPLDLVDELLVMAMPFSAMHDRMQDCRAFDAVGDEGEKGMTTPFAALRERMDPN